MSQLPPAAAPASSTPAPSPTTAPAPGAPKPTISFEDFAKLDLRVARILTAEPHPHPKVDRLWKLTVDDGSGHPRTLCAGIREHYQAEQLLGRLIIIVANLAPKDIRGVESRGMLLAASNTPKQTPGDAATTTPATPRRVILLRPDADIEPGSIVS
jgi:methionyl-tRNA synthetase